MGQAEIQAKLDEKAAKAAAAENDKKEADAKEAEALKIKAEAEAKRRAEIAASRPRPAKKKRKAANSSDSDSDGPVELAGGYYQDDKVAATQDITVKGKVIVSKGAAGVVFGPAASDPDNRIAVVFESSPNSVTLNVVPRE